MLCQLLLMATVGAQSILLIYDLFTDFAPIHPFITIHPALVDSSWSPIRLVGLVSDVCILIPDHE